MGCLRYNTAVPDFDPKTAALLGELRQTLSELDRFSQRARELLDEIEGKRDKEIEARVQQILSEMRARARAKELGLPPPARSRKRTASGGAGPK